jgi:hypothetical protein
VSSCTALTSLSCVRRRHGGIEHVGVTAARGDEAQRVRVVEQQCAVGEQRLLRMERAWQQPIQCGGGVAEVAPAWVFHFPQHTPRVRQHLQRHTRVAVGLGLGLGLGWDPQHTPRVREHLQRHTGVAVRGSVLRHL